VQTFASVEVDVDTDGEGLVIEFPSDQEFSLQLAEEPATRELLKRALAAVFGSAPPFRYQLGRGGVRPMEAPVAAPAEPLAAHVDVAPDADGSESDADEPITEHYEQATGLSEPTAQVHGGEPTAAGSAVEHLIRHGLGATIVETRSGEPNGEDV